MEIDNDYGLIKKAFDKQDDYVTRWKTYENYYRSKHSKAQEKKLENQNRSKLFVPVTRNIVNILKSIFSTSFFGAGCPIEINSGFEDVALNEQAHDKQKVVKYYYDLYKPRKELVKAFSSGLVFQVGIVATYWDKEKEKVQTFQIPATDVAFDWEARNTEDLEFLAYKFHKSKRQLKDDFDTGFYKPSDEDKREILDDGKDDHERYEIKEIYKRENGKKWKCKTYCDTRLLRTETFERLPFQFGYALEDMTYIDEDERKDQILCYGGSVVDYIRPLQDEINIKRNQKNDIQEEAINPSIIVPDTTNINPADLKRGAGKRIKAGKTDGIMFMPSPAEHNLNADLAMLENDISNATGVNSIQQGQTGASDRRSAMALSVVNSNSSMRVEEMIMTMNDTLFEHWAKAFTYLVLKNADDEVINKITNKEFPFGKKGERDLSDFRVSINFGLTIDKEKKIADLVALAQLLAQNPNINPQISMNLIKEVLQIRLGEGVKMEEIFMEDAPIEQAEAPQNLDPNVVALMQGGM